MSWYDPRDWAGRAVADGVRRTIEELGEAIRKNPEILYIPIAITTASVGVISLADSTGKNLGPVAAEYIAETIGEELL